MAYEGLQLYGNSPQQIQQIIKTKFSSSITLSRSSRFMGGLL
jgi:hypothetical protein